MHDFTLYIVHSTTFERNKSTGEVFICISALLYLYEEYIVHHYYYVLKFKNYYVVNLNVL